MCLFCDYQTKRSNYIYENELVYAIKDQFPVSPGHALVITKRHFASYFDATKEEILAIDEAMRAVKDLIEEIYHPDGYNIGVNQGADAGQTIMHLHVHLIPRYKGDVKNPRGGVRGAIPGKQHYGVNRISDD